MDSLVTAALQTIDEEKDFYESVPNVCLEHTDLGTIDITNKNLCEQDDATLFAQRIGGSRTKGDSKDTDL
ncbi:hypothetical protein GOP47_0022659 [Adiantum capillus-veneris]|uniref:Uncharacterized protein n=1 Tax=Adiantum capillus-veneris TaxID=13818 RepID=A0A9D4U689_ADICA|nr:hypothetical protein GOP47_0022659 [Adiantum capillus-veneris]